MKKNCLRAIRTYIIYFSITQKDNSSGIKCKKIKVIIIFFFLKKIVYKIQTANYFFFAPVNPAPALNLKNIMSPSSTT